MFDIDTQIRTLREELGTLQEEFCRLVPDDPETHEIVEPQETEPAP